MNHSSGGYGRRLYSGKRKVRGGSLKLGLLVLALAIESGILMSPAFCSGGNLDPSFGQSGIVRTDFLGGYEQARGLALQPDGKIVIAGFAEDSKTAVSQFAIARYNTDGSLDPAFGAGGTLTTTVMGAERGDVADAVLIQPDGKIVVAGITSFPGFVPSSGFAVVRYNSDGSLDPSFGQGGKVTTDLGVGSAGWGMVLQPDGKIVVAGFDQINSILARYNVDGSLDSSFGSGGVVKTKIGSGSQFFSVALQPDGKLLGAGDADNSGFGFGLARYNPDGSLDNGFGSGGTVITDIFGFRDFSNSVIVQRDGLIVLAGGTLVTGGDGASRFALARYKKNGSLDQSFGQGGKVFTTAVPGSISGVAQQDDGKLVAVGQGGMARYNPDGSLDTSFGSDGAVKSVGGGLPQAVLVQPDDLILVAGGNSAASNNDFLLARYQSGIPIPTIQQATVTGKRLEVTGVNFDEGATILVNGQEQQTMNDAQNPASALSAKRAGKHIQPGQAVTLTVRNHLGTLSHPFPFTRAVDQ